jgi:hypothetical protein
VCCEIATAAHTVVVPFQFEVTVNGFQVDSKFHQFITTSPARISIALFFAIMFAFSQTVVFTAH